MRALHLTALRSGASRAAAVAAALLCFSLAFPTLAGAASRGTGVGTEAVASASWGAKLSTASFTFTSSTDQTSTVANSGTIALTGISYSVSIGSAFTFTTFSVYVCTTAWVSNKCSGGAGTKVGGTLSPSSTTTITSTVVPPVGGNVYLQIEPSLVLTSTTVSISTSVSRSQVRAAVTTNH